MPPTQKTKDSLFAYAKTKGYSSDDLVAILREGGVEGKFDPSLYDKYIQIIDLCSFAGGLNPPFLPKELFLIIRAANMEEAALDHQKALIKQKSIAIKWHDDQIKFQPDYPQVCPLCGAKTRYNPKRNRCFGYRWGWECEKDKTHFHIHVWKPVFERVRAKYDYGK